jgi:hypothetical protein
MRSFIAALRTLVLPFGATTGRRIVLDGINGLITIFDAGNNERIVIGESGDSIELITGTVGEATGGQLKAVGVNAGQPDAQAELEIISPSLAAPDNKVAAIILTSEADDGVEQPSVFIDAETVTLSPATVANGILLELLGTLTKAARLIVNGGTAFPTVQITDGVIDIESGGDIQIADRSLPRGRLTTRTQTSDMSATSGTTEKDIFTTAPDAVTLDAGRAVKLTLSIRSITASVANDIYSVRIKEGATQLMEQNFRGIAAAVGSDGMTLTVTLDASYNPPSAGSHSYKATIVRAAGTGTATIQGAAGRPIQFTVEDVGPA